ncbi:MAG: hypothetical protein AMDU1_APLC00071G0003 [Thermoplasmatales archaeon A-plasma]|nr:MAG: hypothetical protein AMDU1_APLC00071G0003 [Thermoplasmatales archaeon A-plasma]
MRVILSFTSQLFSIILGFFQSLGGIIAADIRAEFLWFGSHISALVVSWGSSFTGFGMWIPAVLVAVAGVTVIGLYLVFVFVDAGKDLVGE